MTLETTLDQLQTQLEELQRVYQQDSQVCEDSLREVLFQHLTQENVLHPMDKIKGGQWSFSLLRHVPDSQYPKEMFTLYHDTSYGESEYKLKMNYYTGGSTGIESPWELDRLQTVGHMAGFLADSQKERSLNQALTRIKEDFKPITEKYYNEKRTLDTQIVEIKHQLGELKKAEFYAQVKIGVTFTPPVRIRIKQHVHYTIEKIKLHRFTYSGKSAEVEITLLHSTNSFIEKIKTEVLDGLSSQPYTVS